MIGKPLSKDQILIVAHELWRPFSPRELSERMGVTVYDINRTAQSLRRMGIDIPKKGDALREAAAELKTEMKQLRAI